MGGLALTTRQWLTFVGSFIASSCAPAAVQPELTALSEVPQGVARYQNYVDIIEARRTRGGYELLLRPEVAYEHEDHAPVNSFRVTLPINAVPKSARLYVVLDIRNRNRPRVIDWAQVDQRVCVPDAWIDRYGAALGRFSAVTERARFCTWYRP